MTLPFDVETIAMEIPYTNTLVALEKIIQTYTDNFLGRPEPKKSSTTGNFRALRTNNLSRPEMRIFVIFLPL